MRSDVEFSTLASCCCMQSFGFWNIPDFKIWVRETQPECRCHQPQGNVVLVVEGGILVASQLCLTLAKMVSPLQSLLWGLKFTDEMGFQAGSAQT